MQNNNKNAKKQKGEARKNKKLEFTTGAQEDEFSVREPFCLGVGEKETQTLKVVWEKINFFF